MPPLVLAAIVDHTCVRTLVLTKFSRRDLSSKGSDATWYTYCTKDFVSTYIKHEDIIILLRRTNAAKVWFVEYAHVPFHPCIDVPSVILTKKCTRSGSPKKASRRHVWCPPLPPPVPLSADRPSPLSSEGEDRRCRRHVTQPAHPPRCSAHTNPTQRV